MEASERVAVLLDALRLRLSAAHEHVLWVRAARLQGLLEGVRCDASAHCGPGFR